MHRQIGVVDVADHNEFAHNNFLVLYVLATYRAPILFWQIEFVVPPLLRLCRLDYVYFAFAAAVVCVWNSYARYTTRIYLCDVCCTHNTCIRASGTLSFCIFVQQCHIGHAQNRCFSTGIRNRWKCACEWAAVGCFGEIRLFLCFF